MSSRWRLNPHLAIAVAICTPAADARAADWGEGVEPLQEPKAAPEPSGFSPFADLSLPAVAWYQRRVAPNSVSRCPFLVSCSSFAIEQVKQHGALGFLYFVDRFFYRENIDVHAHYEWVISKDGRVKLDDALHP